MAGKETKMTYKLIKQIPFLYGPCHGKVKEFVDGNAVQITVRGQTIPDKVKFVYILRERVIDGETYLVYEFDQNGDKK